jgi:hypothetical protein
MDRFEIATRQVGLTECRRISHFSPQGIQN